MMYGIEDGIPIQTPFITSRHIESTYRSCNISRKLFEEIHAYLERKKPEPQPNITTIRGDGPQITITTPTGETTLQPEHPACYLEFEDTSIVKAWKGWKGIEGEAAKWAFQLVRSGGLQPPIGDRHEFDLVYPGFTLMVATDFNHHYSCGKSTSVAALKLPCLVKPCCVCGSDPRSLMEQNEQWAKFHKPGLDSGNNSAEVDPDSEFPEEDEDETDTERKLNPQQEEFAREAGWTYSKNSNAEDLEEAILDNLMSRHHDVMKETRRKQYKTVSIHTILQMAEADPSIPLGWLMEAGYDYLMEARSALALAKIGHQLHTAGIIGVETFRLLCKPWTAISPGRSTWSNPK